MEKIVDGKKITCAVVIIDAEGSILACHGTNKGENTGYDFPKGCAEEDESDVAAAIRELREETDILLHDGQWSERDKLIDCGVHPHNKEKRIHIYLYRVNTFPSLDKLKCTTYFEYKGQQFPEVDGYRIVPKSERSVFNKVLWNKFPIIDKFNEGLV